jgi:hypothetical protein
MAFIILDSLFIFQLHFISAHFYDPKLRAVAFAIESALSAREFWIWIAPALFQQLS